MKKVNEGGGRSTDIRKQAEERLKGKTTDLKKLSSGDAQSLVHELQVHQIELEMQNEELRRAQKELEEARNRYSNLYDFAPIGYFTLDNNGLILEVNLTGAKKLGRERSYLIKKPFSLYIHGNKDPFYSYLREIFSTEKQMTCELKLVDMKGNIFDARLESMPVHDSDGNLLAWTALSDITERKRIEDQMTEQGRRAISIAELEFDALCGFDLDPLFEAACSLTAHTLGVEYCRIMELMPDGNQVMRAGIGFNKKLIDGAISIKGAGSLADFTLQSESTVIFDDLRTEIRFSDPLLIEHGIISGISSIIGELSAPYGVIGAHTIKERRFTHEDILFMETVANVLGETIKRKRLEDSLSLARDEAQSANRVKTNFLMTMSHELKTPLNAILGFSDLLKQKTTGELNDKQEHFLDNIISGGNNLHVILSQILEIVRMDEGKSDLSIDNIHVPEIVDLVISVIKEKAQKQNVIMETDLDPQLEYIKADKLKFKQILINLLDNAMKFSKPEGGIISVRANRKGDMAEFSVSDTGIGIKEEDMEKIFQTFTQLHTGTSRKYGGTGIGLAIVKQIVELHRGRIWVESKEGEGSTFMFTLPLKSYTNEVKQ